MMEFRPAKKLGFGLMRMPRLDPANAAAVDVEQVKKMVDLFMSKGFTYFDTAWMYNGFASENVARQALVERYPRDSFTLATKLHSGFINSLEDRDKVFNEQLRKTGAGYFDYYLLHAPLLPSTTIHLSNGKDFTIVAPRLSDKRRYVQSVKLNGVDYPSSFLSHSQLMEGGVLEFIMSERPSNWGQTPGIVP